MPVPEEVKKIFRPYVQSFIQRSHPSNKLKPVFDPVLFLKRNDGLILYFLQQYVVQEDGSGGRGPFISIVVYDPSSHRVSKLFEDNYEQFKDCYWEDLKGDGENELAVLGEYRNGDSVEELTIYYYIPKSTLYPQEVLLLDDSEGGGDCHKKSEIVKKEKGYVFIKMTSVCPGEKQGKVNKWEKVKKIKLDFNQDLKTPTLF